MTIVRYLASHPEERPRIGDADPDAWLHAPLTVGQGDVDGAKGSSGAGPGDR